MNDPERESTNLLKRFSQFYFYSQREHYRWPGTALSFFAGLMWIIIPLSLMAYCVTITVNTIDPVNTRVSNIHRTAWEAPTASVMADRLDLVAQNLKELGLDHGFTYGWDSPKTDQARAYADVLALSKRARDLSATDANSADMALNMNDLRLAVKVSGVAWVPGVFWDALSTKLAIVFAILTFAAICTADILVNRPIKVWQHMKNDPRKAVLRR